MESYNYEDDGERYWMKQRLQQQIHDSPVRHVTVTVTTEVTDGSLRFPTNDQGLEKRCFLPTFQRTGKRVTWSIHQRGNAARRRMQMAEALVPYLPVSLLIDSDSDCLPHGVSPVGR